MFKFQRLKVVPDHIAHLERVIHYHEVACVLLVPQRDLLVHLHALDCFLTQVVVLLQILECSISKAAAPLFLLLIELAGLLEPVLVVLIFETILLYCLL